MIGKWNLVILSALMFIVSNAASAQDNPNAALPAIKLKRNTIETAKHLIELDDSGLPKQITIKADRNELPLENRAGGKLSPAELQALDRGPQLRSPIRLEVRVEGRSLPALPQKKARPKLNKGVVACSSTLRAGPVRINLGLSYERDGSLAGKLSYKGGTVEALELVLAIAGPVDTLVVGNPVAARARAYAAKEFALAMDEGIVWGNAAKDAKKCGRAAPGVVKRLFVGNGGRGFTWLTARDKGWMLDKAVSSMTLERNEQGQVTWRIKFVNHKAKVSKNTVSFRLLTHPARPKVSGHRKLTWLKWTGREKSQRADLAVINELTAGCSLLTGPAGGDALSAVKDSIATYPIGLFRYLAGTHTGLAARLQPNSVRLTTPRAILIPGRAVLGRALLHDIGLDASGLAHLAQARRLLTALHKFGCFAGDGKTEFIPYWRSGRFMRYGEAFAADDVFSLSTENPTAKVYVSIFRRPRGGGKKGYKAFFIIVNESDQDMRQRLHILKSNRLFGGLNALLGTEIHRNYDYSGTPADGDWRRAVVTSMARSKLLYYLQDLEDGSPVVRCKSANKNVDIYGPIFVRRHDYRVVYGFWDPSRQEPPLKK